MIGKMKAVNLLTHSEWLALHVWPHFVSTLLKSMSAVLAQPLSIVCATAHKSATRMKPRWICERAPAIPQGVTFAHPSRFVARD